MKTENALNGAVSAFPVGLSLQEEAGMLMESRYELSTNTLACYLEQDQKTWIMGCAELDGPVNGAVLQKAADDLVRIMPVLSARKAAAPEGDRYVLVSGGAPLRVRERAGREKRAEGSMIDLSFEGNAVYADVSHALTDGCGYVRILRCLLMRYLSLMWDEEPVPFEAFREMFPNDYADPFDTVPSSDFRLEFRYPHAEFFRPEELDPSAPRTFFLDCDERKVMRLAKHSEGSFSGVLAGALGSALMNCRAGDAPVVITCPMNMRNTLGCTQTLQNCTQSMHYVLVPEMRKYTFLEKLSMLKGQLYIQRSEECCLPSFAQWRSQILEIGSIPSISGKADALRASMRKSPYPIVSDLGAVEFGKYDPHILNLRIGSSVMGIAGILLVAHRFAGRCRMHISTTVSSLQWLDQFRQILAQAGIETEMTADA